MFSYECWTCDKNHKATPREALSLFTNGLARVGISIGGKFLPLQTRRSVETISDLRAWSAKR